MSETRTQGAYCARVRRRKFFLILQHWDILVIRSDLQSVLESRCFTLFPFKAPMRNHASVLRRTEQHTKVPLQISKDMFSCGDLSRHLRHKCAPLLFSPQAHTIGGCTRVYSRVSFFGNLACPLIPAAPTQMPDKSAVSIPCPRGL